MPTLAPRYDMVLLGGGCASLSLLVRLIQSGQCKDKRFLVIDASDKKSNDRTWCYWEKGTGYFEEVVHHRWTSLDVKNYNVELPLELDSYQYKMIRGLDFYQHCHQIFQTCGQVDFLEAKLSGASFANRKLTLLVEGTSEPMEIESDLVFNSIPGLNGVESMSGEHLMNGAQAQSVVPVHAPGVVNLLQHFKGLIIDTTEHQFDPHHANLMDFRTDQQHGTTFFYVLPLSTNRALVEYTLFSPALLSTEQYDEALGDYISNTLGIKNYRIVEEEFGIIPMTNYRFKFYDRGLYNIGTAGGQTKGSSGYTYQFIQKRTAQLASILTRDSNWSGVEKKLRVLGKTPARFHFYDHVLLNVLHNHYLPGNQVFTRLFERNSAHQVFRFLDNETTLPEELKIISSLPTWPFLKAALKTI